MRELFWIIISLFLCACGASADFTLGDANVDTVTAQKVSPLRVRLRASDEVAVAQAVALGGQMILLGAYDIMNDAPQENVVTAFTVKAAGDTDTLVRVGYAWGDHPDDIVAFATISPDGSATFRTDADPHTRLQAASMRALRVFGVVSRVDHLSSVKSGARASAAVSSLIGLDDVAAVLEEPLAGTSYHLRKSQPHVASRSLPDAALRLEKLYLFSWGVSADPAGDVAVKQFGFHVDLRDVELCEFQLRRNTRLAEASEISVTALESMGTDLEKDCLRTSGNLVVTFAREELVRAGAETVFTLRARVARMGEGAFVNTRFLHGQTDATSRLKCETGPIVHLDASDKDMPALLWSDLSQAPHSDTPCRSSGDWTGDASITGLEAAQLLK